MRDLSNKPDDPLERIRKIDPGRVKIQVILRNALLFAGFMIGVALYLILTIVLLWEPAAAILLSLPVGIIMMGLEYLMWRIMTKSVAKKLESGDLKPL